MVGQAIGVLFGNWQQTETHWVVPLPLIRDRRRCWSSGRATTCIDAGSGPVLFVSIQGSTTGWLPTMNVVDGLGVADHCGGASGATDAMMDASVDGVPPLIVTEHHESKFRTVSVTPPPLSPPPSATPPSDPPSEVPESVSAGAPPPARRPAGAPARRAGAGSAAPTPIPPPELLPPSPVIAGAGEGLLLHATAPATATSAPMLATGANASGSSCS